jgi:hypothetical protein
MKTTMTVAGLGLAQGIREISLQDSISQQNLVKDMKIERYERPVQSLANFDPGKCWEVRHQQFFYDMEPLEKGANPSSEMPGIFDFPNDDKTGGHEF